MKRGVGDNRLMARGKRAFPVACSVFVAVLVAAQGAAAQAQPPLTPIPTVQADSTRLDSLAAARAVLRADTTLIVKHHFNHRQQIITGSAIMAGLAMVMVMMNNYNPRGFQN